MKEEMEFKKISSLEQIADFVAQEIISHLINNERVLWFLPGGSAIKVIVLAAKQIIAYDHHNLTITLTDERYGDVGHQDSNWQQLQTAGFSLPQAQLIPVLLGREFLETAISWAAKLEEVIKSVDYIIGLFGIGNDGHTAGILPGSSAIDSTALTCAYEAGKFKRITITPSLIASLDEAVVFASGEAKWPVIRSLLNEDLPIKEQPAQILKTLKKLIIFSDYENSN